MTDQPIRILIVDDHTVVRKGLKALMLTEPGLQVVGEAADGEEAVRRARILKPDVILMDMSMPHKDGVQATLEIKQESPEARILVLTSFAEDQKILEAIKAGALGYLLKDASPEELLKAIQEVYRGQSSLHPAVAQKVIRAIQHPDAHEAREENALTDRELEILRLIAEGLPNQQIATRLSISERTVRTHVSNILRKLKLPNRTQAALYAVKEGITQKQ